MILPFMPARVPNAAGLALNIKAPLTRILTGLLFLSFIHSVPGALAQGLSDPIPESIEVAGSPLALRPVADGMTAPNWGAPSPVHEGHLLVTDQVGILWDIDVDSGEKRVFADLSDRLVSLGVAGPGTFDERGLLGVAFHPDYAGNGLLYTYTSEPTAGAADFSTLPPGTSPNHHSVISEWVVPDPLDPAAVLDPTSRREVLRIAQPQFNHDAGTLVFGPDGLLYVSLGDGGAADDQGTGHGPGGNGQDPGNVLGSILRIDPLGNDSANGQYGIPESNPFLGMEGFLDEIFAYGFRNPFRISFDRSTGELYCADVGQNDIEEIDIVVAGGNYGWSIKEGSFLFDANGENPGFVFGESGAGPEDLIDPIAEYDHDEGIAVVGGFVYRGRSIPPLRGAYVFGDFFHPASGSGRLFFLRKNPADETGPIHELRIQGDGLEGYFLLGFGQDAEGEVYVMANATATPFGETGVVLKIVPGFGPSLPSSAASVLDLVAVRASPNPFSANTRIEYEMPVAGHLTIRVFDVHGALVDVLVDEPVPGGTGSVAWSGRDHQGRSAAPGLYFLQMEGLGQSTTSKLIMLR